MESSKRPLVGVGVIIFRNRQILLGLRKNAHGAGMWAPPGGHLEYGETPEQCAIRETLEETSLVVSAAKRGPYSSDVFLDSNKHYITLFLFADYRNGTAVIKEPDKCSEWKWFDVNALPKPLFLSLENVLNAHPDFLSRHPTATAR